ncbi:hypothetical protein GALL_436190 [mine drainage metagenome]|uniref:Uncharacterized protein n=1 Tax=mine drainage metagenome TaxID=410659 RepID=A0A1J5PSY8_9ZZZZ
MSTPSTPDMRRAFTAVAMMLNMNTATMARMPSAAQRGASTYLRPWLISQSVDSAVGPVCTTANTAATARNAAQNTQNITLASRMPTTSRSTSCGRYQ